MAMLLLKQDMPFSVLKQCRQHGYVIRFSNSDRKGISNEVLHLHFYQCLPLCFVIVVIDHLFFVRFHVMPGTLIPRTLWICIIMADSSRSRGQLVAPGARVPMPGIKCLCGWPGLTCSWSRLEPSSRGQTSGEQTSLKLALGEQRASGGEDCSEQGMMGGIGASPGCGAVLHEVWSAARTGWRSREADPAYWAVVCG